MHHLPVHDTLVLLESDREHGLTSDETARRLQRHGPNVLPRVERRGALVRLLLAFHHPLIVVQSPESAQLDAALPDRPLDPGSQRATSSAGRSSE